MGTLSKNPFRITPIPRCIVFLAIVSLAAVLFLFCKVEKTKTVTGHNLEPTPWHPFVQDESIDRVSTILHCSFLYTCPSLSSSQRQQLEEEQAMGRQRQNDPSSSSSSCPSFFVWIHQDLSPWTHSRISMTNLMEARKYAAFRIVISGGRLYADFYYACVQSRAMFTVWGLLQLLRRYPGRIPDVDLMFDCMDKAAISRSEYDPPTRPPPPLFRYCTTNNHFDIPFPDWSFWGWPEVNIQPWDEEFRSIKEGSQALNWTMKHPTAYWKGNPDVNSPIRTQLLKCNGSRKWGAQIMRQNWVEESKSGFEQSKLSRQCDHRQKGSGFIFTAKHCGQTYSQFESGFIVSWDEQEHTPICRTWYKIYAEGYAWSVSLKYIISCGSLALIIHPQYDDFFSRGLMPRKNYWPVSLNNLCPSIKLAVDWGNLHPSEAKAIGKRGQDFMLELNMERVYDYMYHLVVEYSKLQDFKPVPPPSAQEMCEESLLCFADPKQRMFLRKSSPNPSSSLPCSLHPDLDLVKRWIQEKQRIISGMERLEMKQNKKKKHNGL